VPSAVALAEERVLVLGPLQPFLDDPDVEEIWINAPDRVFVARRGVSELTTTILTAGEVQDLVERMLAGSGRRVDVSSPFCDAALPDGSRLHVVIPDITRTHWSVNIRRFRLRAASLDQLVSLGTLSWASARFLEACVLAGLNLVVAGGTQAGKTTMLGCLVTAVPPRERIVSCEEVFEIAAPAPDWVAMQCRQPSLDGSGEVTLRRLVVEALRMRPDRIVVGEVRAAEAMDLLIALNAGLPGMATVHASSAREAVTKLCTLPLLAGPNVSSSFVVPTVANAVDVVVHLRKDPSGARRVTEIAALTGRVEQETVEVAPLFVADPADGGRLARAGGFPRHAERFAAAGIDLPALLDERRP
jgi:pilus assembly protein CpaF